MAAIRLIAIGGFLFWIASWFLWPVGVWMSSLSGEVFSILSQSMVWRVVLQSVAQALVSTALSVLVGLLLGSFRLAKIPLLLPSFTPTLSLALVVLSIATPLGFHEGWGLLILAHVWMNGGFLAAKVQDSLGHLPKGYVDVARTLGSSPIQVWREVKLPWLKETLIQNSLQIYLWCSLSMTLVVLLGGGGMVQGLESEIYFRMKRADPDWEGAFGCALLQIVVSLIPWWFLGGRRENASPKVKDTLAVSRFGFLGWIYSIPLLWIVGISLFRLPALQGPWVNSLLFSIMLAGACAGMAGMLVILFLQIPGRWVSGWMTLLSGVSVMLVVVGHAYTYGIPTSEWGSVLQVLFLLVSLQIPWMYRWLRPEFLRLPWKEFHAARTLGASAIRAYFDVLLPHVRPSVLRAMSLAAAFAVGEWAALSLLGLRGEVPLPVRIVRLRGQYEFQDATTLSSVLLLTAMWWIVLGEKITRRNQKI